MTHSQRRGLAFLTFVIAVATFAVAIAAIGYFHPDKNANWVWYGTGPGVVGIYFGARKATACMRLLGCETVEISSIENAFKDVNSRAIEDMAKAADAAFYGTIFGVIFLGIFAIWMLMATTGKHAHVHGRHCSFCAAIAFALAFGLWLAYRPYIDGFEEGYAFYAIVVACALSVICYVVSHQLSGGQRHGYTRV